MNSSGIPFDVDLWNIVQGKGVKAVHHDQEACNIVITLLLECDMFRLKYEKSSSDKLTVRIKVTV